MFLKLNFEPDHYQTVDGDYYQLLAQKLKNAEPFVIEGLENKAKKAFSPYPPGFPVLLMAGNELENIIQIPSILCLHTVLLVCLGLAWIWLGLPLAAFVWVCFTDTFIELGSYKWSEFSFIIGNLFLALWISRKETKREFNQAILLSIFLFGLFLIRYAEMFAMIFLAYKIWVSRGDKEAFGFWLKTICLSLLWYGFWFFGEYLMYGQATGGDRYANPDSNSELIANFSLGIVNQLLVFKDFEGSSFFSFISGLVSLGLMLLWLYFGRLPKLGISSDETLFERKAVFNLSLLALSYFCFMVPVRWHFYFAEGFDLRLLGPGFGFLLASVSLYVFTRFGLRKKYAFLLIWVLLSFFFNIPKREIFLSLQEKIWNHTGPVFNQSSP